MKLFFVIFSGHIRFPDGVNGWLWLSSDEVQIHCVCLAHVHTLGCVQNHESESNDRQMGAIQPLPSSMNYWI